MSSKILEQELSNLSAIECAIRLIGCDIVRYDDNKVMVGRIVETEAYDQSDLSSHSYRGITKRNSVMFGLSGRAYVYFTYGMHYCMNIVTGKVNEGSAVLIRALIPLTGIDQMKINRKTSDLYNLLSGPAKICQALSIDKSLNGHNLVNKPLLLRLNQPLNLDRLEFSPRIGIKEPTGNRLFWRVYLKSSVYLSRKVK